MKGNLPFLLCCSLYLRAIFKYKGGLILFWRGDLTEGFLRYKFGGLIFGGAYFRNFTVPKNDKITAFCQTKYVLEALRQSLPITKMNFEKLLHKANKFSKTTINCNSF